jgi:hypothetical protein
VRSSWIEDRALEREEVPTVHLHAGSNEPASRPRRGKHCTGRNEKFLMLGCLGDKRLARTQGRDPAWSPGAKIERGLQPAAAAAGPKIKSALGKWKIESESEAGGGNENLHLVKT